MDNTDYVEIIPLVQTRYVSMNLIEAANFLGLDKGTVRARAKTGKLPGAKVGKCWRFLEVDLVTYIRSLYPSCASQGAISGSNTIWHYKKEVEFGGSTSTTSEEEYEEALGLK